MQFRLLGPVEVHTDDGHVLSLPRRHERCLLAILLLEAGRVVPVDRLLDLLWEDNPPQQPHQAIRSYVSHVRAMLGRAAATEPAIDLAAHGGGYRLNVDPDAVDAHRFRRLLDQANHTVDPQSRDRLLREALALWRGPALHKAASDRLRQRLCADLEERRLHAIEASIEVRVELGRHRELLPELARISTEHPVRERLVELHMLALYHEGRTAEALDLYDRTRSRLRDDLGLDPGVQLQQVHQAILRGEPVPTARPGTPRTEITPAQLPLDLPSFTGRGEQLDRLDRLLAGANSSNTAAPAVMCLITGSAGVGKTTLAVHWSHRVAARFPDGQLYLNLRGFDPAGMTMDPAEAMRRFLDALDVPAERIPTELDAQATLYRSRLAGRRMLIVLDNARDSTQVRPLLPGVASCLVLVTSRNDLTGVVAMTGAHPITLDLLSRAEAHQVVARRVGADRSSAEPDAVEEIITSCARLPLALAITTARAAANPRLPLTKLAGELRQAREHLDAFTGDDPHSDLRAVFSWSYNALSPDAAQLFRLLGLHPGPDVSAPAAASLAALSTNRTRLLLTELVRASLLVEHTHGRYTLHDLLRSYARDLTHTTDPVEQRHAATRRMLEHYLHAAHSADRLLYPNRDPITLVPPGIAIAQVPLVDHQQALDWFAAELPVLLALIVHAASGGWDTYAWQLAWTCATFLNRRGRWQDYADTQRTALAAGRRLADPIAQAHAHRYLAHAYSQLGRHVDAHTHLGQALDLYRHAGDQTGQARAHHVLTMLYERQGRHAEALDHARQALDLYCAAGHRQGQADALNALGWYHAQLGNYREALVTCQDALLLHQELGDLHGQADTWDSLGYAHRALGHHTQAIFCYQHATELYRDLGNRHPEASTLVHLGETHQVAGHIDAARNAWQQALTILDDLRHPDAREVHIRLSTLEP